LGNGRGKERKGREISEKMTISRKGIRFKRLKKKE
jgi:hypothetical protein